MSVKPRFDKGGSLFGLAHRKLPVNYGLFDIDSFVGKWLRLSKKEQQERGTFIEYRCLKFDKNENKFNLDRINFVAMFEQKHKKTERIEKEYKEFKPGTAAWAELMFCQKLGMRFFLVLENNGYYPMEFIEYDYDGKQIGINILNQEDDVEVFFKDKLKIN